MRSMLDKAGRLVLGAGLLGLLLAGAATAEPVVGRGVAVGLDLGKGEIYLDPGPVLEIGEETEIVDVERGAPVRLGDLHLVEGVSERPVVYRGDAQAGRVVVRSLEVGGSID